VILALLTGCGAGGVLAVEVVDHPETPLGAMVRVQTDPRCRVSIAIDGDGLPQRHSPWSAVGESHELPVLGLRAQVSWTLTPWAECQGSASSGESVAYVTGELGLTVPELTLTVTDSDEVTPGVTFLVPVLSGNLEPPVFLGLDEAGQVVWAYQDPLGDTSHADPFLAVQGDGSVLVAQHDSVAELDWGGRVIWELRGSDLGLEDLHHDAVKLDDGSVLALVEEVREDDVAGRIVADGIVQLSQDGDVLWQWSPFDHLDWSELSDKQAGDWIHANALVVHDGVIWLSSRGLDRIIGIDHGSGQVLWQLGEGADFDLLGGRWFDGQHAPEWHPEEGVLVLYDNDLGGGDSRAVVYRVDLEARTLRQRWAWSADSYTPRLGDADLLSTGALLVTAGGPEARDAPAVITEVVRGEGPIWELQVHDAAVYRASRLDWPWDR